MNEQTLQEIALDDIVPDPKQPRKLPTLDALIRDANAGDPVAQSIRDKLQSLATSILEIGLQQPIIVHPLDDSDKFIIYDGHRRWLAMEMLHREGYGNGKILSIVRPATDIVNDNLLGQIITNVQREDLNVFELARNLQGTYENMKRTGGSVRLMREDGSIEVVEITPDETNTRIWEVIEKKVGIGRSRRYQIQAVLKLPAHIQQLAEDHGIPESRLRYIIPLEDEQLQETAIQAIANKNLSNSEIRLLIEQLQKGNTPVETAPVSVPKPIQIKSALKPLRQMAQDFATVQNVSGLISTKDPRTVKNYIQVIPDLRATIRELEIVLEKLSFLETR